MANERIGVGIIGLSPGRSWAATSIVPGLKALPEYEIVAVSTTRMESAQAAAKEFNIPHAFDDHRSLVNHPDVDVVVVSVKVPHHLELATAAIEAGKHVYCEWPLGNGLAEAEILTVLARTKGIRAVVGLQARSSPAINYLKDLIKDGYIGQVKSTSIIAAGLNGMPVLESPNAYLADVKNGANMLTISFGHTIDAVLYVLGTALRDLSATTATQVQTIHLIDTGEDVPNTAEDQVAVTGLLDGGAIFSAHYHGGLARDPATGFIWQIHGTEGDMQITAMAGLIQMFDITIHASKGDNQPMEVLSVPEKYTRIPDAEGFAQNIAQAFRCMAADMRDGTTTCPTFDDAVISHRMIAAIQESAKSGRRQVVA